jgi:thiamine-monophosphate kinase
VTVPSSTVSDRSEAELIALIQAQLSSPPAWLTIGIGDDAAAMEPARNRLEVVTVDALVEGVHFERRFTPPDAIGHRALAVNLSDIAAMGAEPRGALLSLALPSDLLLDDFTEMTTGFARLATASRVSLVGGNLTRTPGPMMIDVTVFGTAKRRQLLARSGARPGDDVYVSGTVGSAAAGLALLKRNALASSGTRFPSAAHVQSAESACVDRYLRPAPRVRLGLLLGRNRAATACVDLSDGLADAAHQIARSSDVGLVIDGSAVPIDAEAQAWFDSSAPDPLVAAATSGDDYELLFTVRPRLRNRLKTVAAQAGTPLTRIGVCTSDRAVVWRRQQAGGAADEPMPLGYRHFR